jgi:hypothetical protein
MCMNEYCQPINNIFFETFSCILPRINIKNIIFTKALELHLNFFNITVLPLGYSLVEHSSKVALNHECGNLGVNGCFKIQILSDINGYYYFQTQPIVKSWSL